MIKSIWNNITKRVNGLIDKIRHKEPWYKYYGNNPRKINYPTMTLYETIEKTGVIDLMLEYNDHIDIIDYKLKNVADNAYKKQLNGYKEYIKNKTHKQVDTYLYSLLDRTLTKID